MASAARHQPVLRCIDLQARQTQSTSQSQNGQVWAPLVPNKHNLEELHLTSVPRNICRLPVYLRISNPVEDISDGDVDTTIMKGRSLLAMTGKNGRVFWSYHKKLDKTYQHGTKD